MDYRKNNRSIGDRWRRFVDKSREYVVTEDNKPLSEPWQKYLPQWDWEEARTFKKKLLQEFSGKKLEDILPGNSKSNNFGSYYEMDYEESFPITPIETKKAVRCIVQNLRLVYGIGPITETKLRNDGYKTLYDLSKHPAYGEEAQGVLSLIEIGTHKEKLSYLQGRLSRSHPNVLHLTSCSPPNNYVFLDIETLGLSCRPLILIGVAKLCDDKIKVRQYFVRSIPEEKPAIQAFIDELAHDSILFSYNGDSFDIPYIQERLNYYQMPSQITHPDYDILLFSRRKWKGSLPNCKLQTIEKSIIGLSRGEDVPGALVPEFYEEYLRTSNIGPILPIIQHNRQDIITLARIYYYLITEWTPVESY